MCVYIYILFILDSAILQYYMSIVMLCIMHKLLPSHKDFIICWYVDNVIMMSYIMINEIYLLSVDYLTFIDEEKIQSHDNDLLT